MWISPDQHGMTRQVEPQVLEHRRLLSGPWAGTNGEPAIIRSTDRHALLVSSSKAKAKSAHSSLGPFWCIFETISMRCCTSIVCQDHCRQLLKDAQPLSCGQSNVTYDFECVIKARLVGMLCSRIRLRHNISSCSIRMQGLRSNFGVMQDADSRNGQKRDW